MRLSQTLSLAAAVLAPSTYSLATYTPSSVSGIEFKVGIPSTSSISASAAGPLYFSITAPGTFSWVGLGIGSQMAGASIFVMYADGNGNVTISGRTGRGHVMPNQDSTLQNGLTLLAGSGIDANGVMTANVRCTSCKVDKSASRSAWISAWKGGNSLATTSTSTNLNEHDNHSQFNFDLTAAALDADLNPFVSSAVTSPGSSQTSTGTSPTSSSESGDDKGNDDNDNSGNSPAEGNNGSQETGTGGSSSSTVNHQKAHGIIMGVTVVLLFPIGAIFMRIVGSAMLHAALQIFSLIGLIVGFALGVRLADMRGSLFKEDGKTHTIFGTVIFACFLIQPVIGTVHHLNYKKTQSRNAVSHAHIWFGRIIMLLAVINGGLGLKLAANTTGGKIAYGVIAGVVGVAYIIFVILKRKGSPGAFGGLSGRRAKTEREGSSGSQVEMR